MVDLKHSREGGLSNLADRHVELPLSEGLPLLLPLQLVEQVLRAHQRGREELQLGPLLDGELVDLLVQPVPLHVGVLELSVKVVKVLHVLRVTLFLVAQGLLLALQELVPALSHIHCVLPRLEQSSFPFLGHSSAHAFDALAERRKADLELVQVGAELVQVVLRLVAEHLEVRPLVQLLEADFEDGNYLLLVVDVEHRVVHDVLEALVGHGLHLLDHVSLHLLGRLTD